MDNLDHILSDAAGRWRLIPVTAFRVRGTPGVRTPENLSSVMGQFNVESSPRYQPGKGITCCNLYISDVTNALGAELPHWVDRKKALSSYPGAHSRETTANDIYDRLLAGVDGYTECTPDVALAKALLGHPVVVSWRNPSGPGHVGLVEPVSDARGILVAQAGAVCGRRIPLRAAFGDRALRMFWHE